MVSEREWGPVRLTVVSSFILIAGIDVSGVHTRIMGC